MVLVIPLVEAIRPIRANILLINGLENVFELNRLCCQRRVEQGEIALGVLRYLDCFAEVALDCDQVPWLGILAEVDRPCLVRLFVRLLTSNFLQLASFIDLKLLVFLFHIVVIYGKALT